MKIYISYFYQIRNFEPYQIPVSTAMYDPKWYHQFQDQLFIFKDKNQVYNGIRCEDLKPGDQCNNLCHGNKDCEYTSDSCEFLRVYRSQIFSLDFNKVVSQLERISRVIKIYEEFLEDPEIILIVYEAPDNKCSERWVLKEWFRSNGYELKEWHK